MWDDALVQIRSDRRMHRLRLLILIPLALCIFAILLETSTALTDDLGATQGAVSISITQPKYGFNVLPNSTRRVFATLQNGHFNAVHWTITSGSARLSSSYGSWIEVTAPSKGSHCQITGTSDNYIVKSDTQFTLEGASTDDPTKKASITFNVCDPKVSVDIVPFYRTLYAGQQADVQSLVWGAVDQNVRWQVTSQPRGGDAHLEDADRRDTVFSATVLGRYELTATSTADLKQSGKAVMYVTGHPMPYPVTRNGTEPVDCTVDPASKGKVYEVGPSQPYKTLTSVPFPTLAKGSTVRLHNEDVTRTNPTTYHEYIQIQTQGSSSQPIRICGVPDEAGNLPVIDAQASSGRADTGEYAAGYGALSVSIDHPFDNYPHFNGAKYVVIEGLSIRNAKQSNVYAAPGGGTSHWRDGSACIRLAQVQYAVVLGNELSNCGNGAFSYFNGNSNWGASNLNVLWEGNFLHDNGTPGSYLEHQMYIQSWGQVVQFNRIDGYTKGAVGSNLKSRGLFDIIRYNYLGDGALRQMDLVDVQDAPAYMSFEGYLSGGAKSVHALYPADEYTADLLAAAQEVWHFHFVYGNIYDNSTAAVPIHFSMDHDGPSTAREGSLYWYSNTFYEHLCAGCSGQRWTLFDTTAGGGSTAPQVEWQDIQIYNNIIWMDDPTKPVFQWNNYSGFIGGAGTNLVPKNWGSNDMTGGPGTGWTSTPQEEAFQFSERLASHVSGFDETNLLTVAARPFDSVTWAATMPVAGTARVPEPIRQMPDRFAFMPRLGYATHRIGLSGIGATDASQELSKASGTPRR